jgi:hypothetical protein
MTTNTNKRAKALMVAVIKQACDDLYKLTQQGVVVDMECALKPWPMQNRRSKRFVHDYKSRSDVIELCEFFTSGAFQRLMTELGYTVPVTAYRQIAEHERVIKKNTRKSRE